MTKDTYERWRERLCTFGVDLAAMILAFLAAHALRFNFEEPPDGWNHVAIYFGTVAVIQFAALYLAGCYRIVWRYVTVVDVPRFVYAVGGATLALVLLRFTLPAWRALRPPFSIALLNGSFFLSGVLLIRLFWRMLNESGTRPAGTDSRRILLIGAGAVGNAVARELRQHRGSGIQVLGFLDDDALRQSVDIQGFPVLGRTVDLERLIRQRHATEVVVALSPAPRQILRDIAHTCETNGVAMRIAPDYHEVIEGRVRVSHLREVDIADLLGREEINLGGDSEAARFFGGRRVMVTGAGGSIGSELARQVARIGPETLVLVDRCEYALYEIDRQLREAGKASLLTAQVADVGDRHRMAALLAHHRPQIVLHAAAHKHVPMMESNAAEAASNNVLATRALGEEAMQAGVEAFVLLSTDKAVKPSSVMGATKRMAEFALQDLNGRGSTRFSAVRFGNVLGASGSVVPLFREQIRQGQPVTVTHPDMRRYFMTAPEAARLVLQAAAMAAGGEIFILDMGEPMRIVELAEEMIRLSGLKPYEDIPITFTGIRPGEKLFEELSTSEEQASRTRHPRIFVARISQPPGACVGEMLDELRALCRSGSNNQAVRQALMRQA